MVVDGTSSTAAQGSSSSEITVALTASTTFKENKAATASSLGLGDCVTATGSADSEAVKASSVTITSTGSTTCQTGPGRGGPPASGSNDA
jgi:hypothetical protein